MLQPSAAFQQDTVSLKNSSELETRIKVVSIDVYNFQNTLQ